jgi:hypothetical protein
LASCVNACIDSTLKYSSECSKLYIINGIVFLR